MGQTMAQDLVNLKRLKDASLPSLPTLSLNVIILSTTM